MIAQAEVSRKFHALAPWLPHEEATQTPSSTIGSYISP